MLEVAGFLVSMVIQMDDAILPVQKVSRLNVIVVEYYSIDFYVKVVKTGACRGKVGRP